MRRIADVHLLSLAEAERRLKIKSKRPGAKLERMLLAAEKKNGRKLFGKTAGGHRRVTMSVLRQFLPEIIPSSVDELERRITRYVRQIDERIDSAVSERVADQVEPRLEELWQRDETIARSVLVLENEVKALSKRVGKNVRNPK